MPMLARAARCAAATAAPGSTARPCCERHDLERAERAEDLLDRDRAEVAQPEDLAGELALSAGEDHAAPLDLGVEGLPVEPVGDVGGRDRARGVAGIGEQLEPERLESGPRRRGTGLVPGEDRGGALVLHQPQALVDLVDDGDGRGERRLALGRGVAMRAEVEVEPRHRGRLHRAPGPRRGGDHRQPGSGHPGLLRAGHDDIDAPGIHLERDGAEPRHAVDEDQRVGALLADSRGQVRDGVHDTGRGLVVGQQHGLDVGQRAQPLANLVGRGGVSPFSVDLGDIGAVDAGDLRESVAERADADAEDGIAGGQHIDDRRLQPARSGGRDHRDVARRPEERRHPGEDPFEHRRELGAAVVDHLATARDADARWQGGRAGDAQVGLEAVHGALQGRGARRRSTDGAMPCRSAASVAPFGRRHLAPHLRSGAHATGPMEAKGLRLEVVVRASHGRWPGAWVRVSIGWSGDERDDDRQGSQASHPPTHGQDR